MLSPAGRPTRENANKVYAKRTSGLRATERTAQGSVINWVTFQNSLDNQRITHVRYAAKRAIFQYVSAPDNREVAPLAVSHIVSLRMKARACSLTAGCSSRVGTVLVFRTQLPGDNRGDEQGLRGAERKQTGRVLRSAIE